MHQTQAIIAILNGTSARISFMADPRVGELATIRGSGFRGLLPHVVLLSLLRIVTAGGPRRAPPAARAPLYRQEAHTLRISRTVRLLLNLEFSSGTGPSARS